MHMLTEHQTHGDVCYYYCRQDTCTAPVGTDPAASQPHILTSRPFFFKMARKQNLDLRCFGPSTLGAGAKTRPESRIKKFTPHCVCRQRITAPFLDFPRDIWELIVRIGGLTPHDLAALAGVSRQLYHAAHDITSIRWVVARKLTDGSLLLHVSHHTPATEYPNVRPKKPAPSPFLEWLPDALEHGAKAWPQIVFSHAVETLETLPSKTSPPSTWAATAPNVLLSLAKKNFRAVDSIEGKGETLRAVVDFAGAHSVHTLELRDCFGRVLHCSSCRLDCTHPGPALGLIPDALTAYGMILTKWMLCCVVPCACSPLCCAGLVDTHLRGLRNIHTLDLSWCENISDVSLLGGVHSLNLRYCRKVTDVSALGKVRQERKPPLIP